MNYLVFLDTRAGELEQVLSGTKTMIIRELDPTQSTAHSVSPGDSLYFLRDNGESDVRVKATAVRVLYFSNRPDLDLSHALKELQPKLQLTEDQFNYWSTQKQVLLVEFESAHKIGVIHTSPHKIADRSYWIAFDESSLTTGEGSFT